jgi:hypothetical protein
MGTQIILIGAPESMSIEAVLAAPIRRLGARSLRNPASPPVSVLPGWVTLP